MKAVCLVLFPPQRETVALQDLSRSGARNRASQSCRASSMSPWRDCTGVEAAGRPARVFCVQKEHGHVLKAEPCDSQGLSVHITAAVVMQG